MYHFTSPHLTLDNLSYMIILIRRINDEVYLPDPMKRNAAEGFARGEQPPGEEGKKKIHMRTLILMSSSSS